MTGKPPAPVEVANVDPIAVEVREDPTVALNNQSADRQRAAGDREAAILSSEGQRAINRLWERTQAVIALSVVEVTLVVVAILIVTPVVRPTTSPEILTAAVTGLVLLSNLVGNVTGFYFSRTNHTKTGGVADAKRGE